MLARLGQQEIGMFAAGRHAFQLAALDHAVKGLAPLLPPHACSPGSTMGYSGRDRTDARNGSSPDDCQAAAETRWILTSRPNRRSAARAASARSSSSTSPTTNTSTSWGGGPASPA